MSPSFVFYLFIVQVSIHPLLCVRNYSINICWMTEYMHWWASRRRKKIKYSTTFLLYFSRKCWKIFPTFLFFPTWKNIFQVGKTRTSSNMSLLTTSEYFPEDEPVCAINGRYNLLLWVREFFQLFKKWIMKSIYAKQSY